MPTNWDSIDPLKIITAENITDAVNDEKLVPRENILTMGAPKKGMTMARMAGTFWFDTSNPYYSSKYNSASNPTGLQLVAKRDITALRPNIGLEARTIDLSSYATLDSYDKANFSKTGYKTSQNSSGTAGTGASIYTVGEQFYYAFHFINSGTLYTQGNVVFTITIPNGVSCVLSGGQPIVSHLYSGSTETPSIAATLSGSTLTITITKQPINPYNISTNPSAYHISVKMTSSSYNGWNDGASTFAVASLPTSTTTPYATNKPLASSFYIKLNFALLTITKTNSYTGTITYNQEFDYTMKISNASSITATGVVFTDVLPTGVTYVSMSEVPPGWTASVSGQTVTVNANSNSVAYLATYYVKIKVRATGENTNISNTATVCANNGFCTSATKANYIDYNRTPVLTSQGYSTCSSNVTYVVYRDTNTNSSTYNQYYVNGASVGATAPSNGGCLYYANHISNDAVTGYKNNCTNTCNNTSVSVVGSTVYLNSPGYPSYETGGSYTSSISQADADAHAKTIADDAFAAGLQNKYNTEGYCTWTATNIAGNYNQSFTRNNCGTNCYGNGTVAYYSPTKYATANSTTSCSDALSSATTAAYNLAYADVQANGQNNANANGSCCCYVADPTCSGCNYLGNRERNTCDNTYRNTEVTAYNSCTCGQSCNGTYYTDYYCDNRDKVYQEKYNCNGVLTGTTNRVDCGCDARTAELTNTNTSTCVLCVTYIIYKDTNRCSGTHDHFFVNGVDKGTTSPTVGSCNTAADYQNKNVVRCVGGTNYNIWEDANPCGPGIKYQYKDASGASQGYGNDYGSAACTFSAYRSGTFTRNNCGAEYTGGSVTYPNTYYYTGINNQAGADAVADSNFNTDGQNYANASGSCTAIQTCKIYDIVAYSDSYYVDGYYTNCTGGTSTFSFYAYSAGSIGQTSCANTGSVVITNYGSGGAAVQENSSC